MKRRAFFQNIPALAVIFTFPIQACKNLMSKTPVITEYEQGILENVVLHLWPADDNGPGAKQINAGAHIVFVLGDRHLLQFEKNLLISGLRWVDDASKENFQQPFQELNEAQKEETLRQIEGFPNGERWLSLILNYVFEALLGAPAYGVNHDGIGWQFTGHTPGYPQPEKSNIYGQYGYGV